MDFTVVGVVLCVIVFLLLGLSSRKKSKNNALLKFLNSWGKEDESYRNYDLIARLHDMRNDETTVNKKTWDNLNFQSLFEKLDRTISPLGKQLLYFKLFKYENDKEHLKNEFAQYQFFRENNDVRVACQTQLFTLLNTKNYFIADLLFRPFPEKPKYYKLFYVSSYVSMILLFLIPLFGAAALVIFLPLAMFHMYLNWKYSNEISSYLIGFAGLANMLKVSKKLVKLDLDIPQIKVLKKYPRTTKRVTRKMGLLTFDRSTVDEFTSYFIELFDNICLTKLVSFYKSIDYIEQKKTVLQNIYTEIASIDLQISMASYMEQYGVTSPEFNNENNIRITNMVHPLVDDCVPNTMEINTHSFLITGSNMSGKTTFVKGVAINLLLAQTLGICLAESATLAPVFIEASIRREDDLTEGKSYYFQEVEEIKSFIDHANTHNKTLYVIDEIYRGTNTVERVSASAAVLNYLAKQNFVLATTHDVELEELLKNRFKMVHFSDVVDNGEYRFDYMIKEGSCNTRNAIKLLEICGYPEEIIDEANKIVSGSK